MVSKVSCFACFLQILQIFSKISSNLIKIKLKSTSHIHRPHTHAHFTHANTRAHTLAFSFKIRLNHSAAALFQYVQKQTSNWRLAFLNINSSIMKSIFPSIPNSTTSKPPNLKKIIKLIYSDSEYISFKIARS
jgi:hypothetical protein